MIFSDEFKLPVKRVLKRVLAPLGLARGWYVDYFPFVEAKTYGLTRKPRKTRVIVTLTSYPGRIGTVHRTIHTLLRQTFRPDAVILWLAESQFPNHETDSSVIPPELQRLLPLGLTIRWTSEDLRSYKKLIPALKEFPDAILVTADDDLYYSRTWLERLWKCYEREKDSRTVFCHRAHQVLWDEEKNDFRPYMSWPMAIPTAQKAYSRFITTGGGVLFPPGVYSPQVMNSALFKDFCPLADDMWFWAQLVLNHVKIRVVPRNIRRIYMVEDSQEQSLWDENGEGGQNDIQLHRLTARFPELLEILRKEREELRSGI